MQGVILGEKARTGVGIGEPSIGDRSAQPGEDTVITDERGSQRGLYESLTGTVDDHGRSVGEAVDDAQHPGGDVIIPAEVVGRVVSCQPEQVVAFGEGQVQCSRDGRDHLVRRLRPTLLFESRVVVDRHSCERRDLLAPEPLCPAALSDAEADVGGLQRLPAPAEELGEARSIDGAHLARFEGIGLSVISPG